MSKKWYESLLLLFAILYILLDLLVIWLVEWDHHKGGGGH